MATRAASRRATGGRPRIAAIEAVLPMLVDDAWYIAHDPQIAAQSLVPHEHYRTLGWREGRAPNPYFDPISYRAACGAAAFDGDPLLHYVSRGEAAGIRPSPLFDPAWYRRTYRLATSQNALADFLGRRFSGDVSPSADFDCGFYLETYPDIRAAGVDPCLHYHATGRMEYRLPRPEAVLIAETGLFDEEFYLFSYEDVRRAGVDPITHYLGQAHERRKPNVYFDPDQYRSFHGADYSYNALTHYLLIGEERGYAPSRYFDPSWYAKSYGLPRGASALAHYLANRKTQRFSPNREFDVLSYVRAAAGDLPLGRDPFLHSLAVKARRASVEAMAVGR